MKVGDRVYFTNEIAPSEFKSATGHDVEEFLNRVLIIEKVDNSDDDCPYYLEKVWFTSGELVPEEIYNTPLYQALKED